MELRRWRESLRRRWGWGATGSALRLVPLCRTGDCCRTARLSFDTSHEHGPAGLPSARRLAGVFLGILYHKIPSGAGKEHQSIRASPA
ncbi:hypothetical protein GQ53DRAFT_116749 [Thozetella sp. PMI_491]|nr:hypothetical protein GQ53DRAFT_116749 [Thozetella sp. PMI_491]